jgi:peptidoglycan/LPS O-acetylase OafA/YrhL
VLNDLLLVFCMTAALYLIASASWYFFESPILRLKRRFSENTRDVENLLPAIHAGQPTKIAGRS